MRKEYHVEQRSAKWHELRAKSVGGSDVSALFGINKYSTPVDVWQSKRGLVKFDNNLAETNDDVRRGVILEDMGFEILLKHETTAGFTKAPMPMFVDEDHHMHHSPDGILIDKEGNRVLVEIKVPRPSRVQAIIENGADLSWVMQVYHGLHCCECDRGLLAILDVNSMRVIVFRISRDESIISRIKNGCRKFFQECVLINEIPYNFHPDNGIEGSEIHVTSNTKENPDAVLPAPDSGIFEEYDMICTEHKRIDNEKSRYKKLVDAWFEENMDGVGSVVTGTGRKIKRFLCKGKSSLDTKTLLAENPDLPLERYTRPAKPYKSIRISGGKK